MYKEDICGTIGLAAAWFLVILDVSKICSLFSAWSMLNANFPDSTTSLFPDLSGLDVKPFLDFVPEGIIQILII